MMRKVVTGESWVEGIWPWSRHGSCWDAPENGLLTEDPEMFGRVPLRRMDGSTLAPTRISICVL